MGATASYKHLDSKLKIGELTLGQWAALAGGTLLAIGWGLYVHPFGTYLTLASSVYVAGIPFCCAFVSSLYGIDLWRAGRSVWRYSRCQRCFAPGPGEATAGYAVHADNAPAPGPSGGLGELLESLWA